MLVYCNHHLPSSLFSVLQTGGALEWLPEFAVRTPFFRIEFRTDEDELEYGQINLYHCQRTVMLLRSDHRGRIQQSSPPEYQQLTPQLFGVHQPHQFHKVQPSNPFISR